MSARKWQFYASYGCTMHEGCDGPAVSRRVIAPPGWRFGLGDRKTHFILTNEAFLNSLEHNLELINDGAYRLVRDREIEE